MASVEIVISDGGEIILVQNDNEKELDDINIDNGNIAGYQLTPLQKKVLNKLAYGGVRFVLDETGSFTSVQISDDELEDLLDD